jgi:hypothetical protein
LINNNAGGNNVAIASSSNVVKTSVGVHPFNAANKQVVKEVDASSPASDSSDDDSSTLP